MANEALGAGADLSVAEFRAELAGGVGEALGLIGELAFVFLGDVLNQQVGLLLGWAHDRLERLLEFADERIAFGLRRLFLGSR